METGCYSYFPTLAENTMFMMGRCQVSVLALVVCLSSMPFAHAADNDEIKLTFGKIGQTL